MLFGFVVFLSAFLLFQVQLIVTKHLLPWFGGTPAVWTTSQMFFQVLLLGGYSYAHVLTGLRSVATQGRIHLGLLICAVVGVFAVVAWGGHPLLAPGWMKPSGAENPVLLLLAILLMSVGLPFFVVSTTGPLLQRWHSRRSVSLGRTYRLYALSNAGSFLGLISYPFGVEGLLNLSEQAWLWAGAFTVFAGTCGVVTWQSTWSQGQARQPDSESAVDLGAAHDSPSAPAGLAQKSAWLLLSFITAVMFLATTNYLSQDVASVPFLWVLPLAIYLLTFVVSFDRPQWYSRRWMSIAAAVAGLTIAPRVAGALPVSFQVLAHSAFLFFFCMLCHGELVRLRPAASQLTLFYLLTALGGALGGTFVSIGAPALFPDLWELQIAMLAGWIVVAIVWWTDRSSPVHVGDRVMLTALVTVVLILVIRYLLERTRLGRFDGVSEQGWTVTLLGAAVMGAFVSAATWGTQLARSPLWPRLLVLLCGLLSAVYVLQRIDISRDRAVYAARNFYGVVRVEVKASGFGELRQMIHGTTMHGTQLDAPGHRRTPTAYYSRSSGIALAATRLVRSPSTASGVYFGVVGLGAGTMSAFAKDTDRVRYYEINQDVVKIVQGPEAFFTFVRDSAAGVAIVSGDGRVSLERELATTGPQGFDLLVMDAFSSDAVPLHLLTVEAFRLYETHLRNRQSILAVNVTNRHLDLEPVVAANAQRLGLHGVRIDSLGDAPVVSEASWILLARDPLVFDTPEVRQVGGRPLRDRLVLFTDNYSNLFRVLK